MNEYSNSEALTQFKTHVFCANQMIKRKKEKKSMYYNSEGD